MSSTPESGGETKMKMNTTSPFQAQVRPDLALKRRSSLSCPTESDDNTVPFEDEGSHRNGQTALQAAWDKLYKARAILEAEQAYLRDDRIAFQGELDQLQQREQNVEARELRVQQLEHQASLAAQEAQDTKDSESALSRLSRVPFEMARSVFSSKK
jgi:hypothetical protein